MKNKTFNIIFFSFVAILLILTLAFLILSKTEGYKCINDPLGYAEKKIGLDYSPTCSCNSFEDGKYITYCANGVENCGLNPN